LSWEKARAEAARLVDRMQYRNNQLTGQVIDIAPIMERCQHQGKFREMVENGVSRILRTRGAAGIKKPQV
jgi:hypothetical protein